MQRRREVCGILMLMLFSVLSSDVVVTPADASDSLIYVDVHNTGGPWDGTFEHPFRRIQDGINASGVNATVSVSNGTYKEHVSIRSSMTVIGDNKSTTIVDGGSDGIVVSLNASQVTISGFTIRNGRIGILVANSSQSRITDITVCNTTDYGVLVLNSTQNAWFYENNLFHNTVNARDSGVNFWDNATRRRGNYWDSYQGSDVNKDGIGDIPYMIPGGTNRDRYPLMHPRTRPPVARFSFTPTSPTTQDILRFTDNSTDPDGSVVSWHWDFGDHNSSFDQHPRHRYSDDGIYSVVLTVTDNEDASNSTVHQIVVVNVPPDVAFLYMPANPTDLQRVAFNDSSFDKDGVIVSWLWDFGDNTTSKLRNVTHQFHDNGTYRVTLRVVDDDGAANQSTRQIQVFNVAPIARFSSDPSLPMVNDTIHFTDASSDADGRIVSWSWDFGDGTTSIVQSPSHYYSHADHYKVSLTVVDNDGASTTETTSIVVAAGSNANRNEFNIIYVVYIAFLAIMIGMVVYITRKFGR